MPDSFVTVARYNTPMEAHLLKGRLEAEGLEARVVDEETVNMAWHLGQAVGGIKVQVVPGDAARARELVRSLTDPREADHQPAGPDEKAETTARRALLAAFLGLIFPPLQFYSAWLALPLLASGGPLPAGVKGRLLLALILDLWLFAAILIFVRFLGFWGGLI